MHGFDDYPGLVEGMVLGYVVGGLDYLGYCKD